MGFRLRWKRSPQKIEHPPLAPQRPQSSAPPAGGDPIGTHHSQTPAAPPVQATPPPLMAAAPPPLATAAPAAISKGMIGIVIAVIVVIVIVVVVVLGGGKNSTTTRGDTNNNTANGPPTPNDLNPTFVVTETTTYNPSGAFAGDPPYTATKYWQGHESGLTVAQCEAPAEVATAEQGLIEEFQASTDSTNADTTFTFADPHCTP